MDDDVHDVAGILHAVVYPFHEGWEPGGHTPLLFPGEVLLGAVLRPIRRVALAVGNDDSEGASYEIERTPAPSVFHPTILYRMGLIGPEETPDEPAGNRFSMSLTFDRATGFRWTWRPRRTTRTSPTSRARAS